MSDEGDVSRSAAPEPADPSLALSHAAPWASAELVALLAEALRQARRDWPLIAVPIERYADHVTARWSTADPAALTVALARDLYLACACLLREPEAVRVFDRDVLRAVAPAVQQIRRDPDFVDEIMQQARERLLVGTAGARPRIADYTGLGALRGWVRVVVVRLALQALRTRDLPVPDLPERDDDGDAPREANPRDPERDHIQARYGGWFKQAIKASLSALQGDERQLIELLVRERLSLAEIGQRLGVNKSTISRRIAAIRARLFDEIQRRAHDELKVGQGDYQSLLRVIQSQLDLSLDFGDPLADR